MTVPLRQPWTPERFFAWAEAQDARYEFDGSQPVAMTGGNAGHALITQNVQAALRSRLRGGPCRRSVGICVRKEALLFEKEAKLFHPSRLCARLRIGETL